MKKSLTSLLLLCFSAVTFADKAIIPLVRWDNSNFATEENINCDFVAVLERDSLNKRYDFDRSAGIDYVSDASIPIPVRLFYNMEMMDLADNPTPYVELGKDLFDKVSGSYKEIAAATPVIEKKSDFKVTGVTVKDIISWGRFRFYQLSKHYKDGKTRDSFEVARCEGGTDCRLLVSSGLLRNHIFQENRMSLEKELEQFYQMIETALIDEKYVGESVCPLPKADNRHVIGEPIYLRTTWEESIAKQYPLRIHASFDEIKSERIVLKDLDLTQYEDHPLYDFLAYLLKARETRAELFAEYPKARRGAYRLSDADYEAFNKKWVATIETFYRYSVPFDDRGNPFAIDWCKDEICLPKFRLYIKQDLPPHPLGVPRKFDYKYRERYEFDKVPEDAVRKIKRTNVSDSLPGWVGLFYMQQKDYADYRIVVMASMHYGKSRRRSFPECL